MEKMKALRKKLAAKGGFTLVELIVVIAILAILAAVAVPTYTGYIKKANEAADLTVLDAVKTAATVAWVEDAVEAGKDPTDITSITVKNATGTNAKGVTVTINTETTSLDISGYYTNTQQLKSEKYSSGATWSSTGDNANTWVKATTGE